MIILKFSLFIYLFYWVGFLNTFCVGPVAGSTEMNVRVFAFSILSAVGDTEV